jgi:3-oxoacyl-[acyl-carrier-protein] synthase II
MTDSNGRVRVVVTGMGMLTPIGNDVESAWASAREGVSGVASITHFDSSNLQTHIAGEVKNFDVQEHLGIKQARRTSRYIQLGIVAAREAVLDSGLDISTIADDTGVLVASGIGGLEWLEKQTLTLHNVSPRRISPFTVPSMIADMAAGMISMEHGARGPNYAIVSACASAAHAIGESAEWIKRGDATAVITGGTEASICALGIASFNAMQAMSTNNDDPQGASRPFDRDRDGFVMGEGAGMLILENYDFAKARGAKIYAEVTGYGATADAYHITAPPENGDGARRAVARALDRGHHSAQDIGYINAHGTSTQLNDAAETHAIKAVFGDDAYKIPMSSTKSMTGHLLGAGGAVESIFSILAIRDNFIPPTINLHNPDPDCDLDYVPNAGRSTKVDVAITTSFGFGGHNACLAFSRAE